MPGADWDAVIAVANRTLLAPALHAALDRDGAPGDIPTDARTYLTFIHERNLERNNRLRLQLLEAVQALNRIGIEPSLVRGAAFLFAAPAAELGSRMMSDLYVMLEHDEVEAGKSCLVAIGYQAHPYAAMARPRDAGVLELYRPSRRVSAYLGTGGVGRHFSRAVTGGVRARLPSPTYQALHLIANDQLHEGDYWTGCVELRHLYELSLLARGADGIDWEYLAAAMADRTARAALVTQLLTLQRLFETEVPSQFVRGLVPRLQHARRMIQIRHGLAGAPLRAAGLVALGLQRVCTSDRPDWMGSGSIGGQVQSAARELLNAARGIYKSPRL